MKRPDVRRMQKHAARSTPDKVSRTFTEREIMNGVHTNWMNFQIKKWALKHGTDGIVDSEAHRDHSNFETLIVLRIIVGEELVARRSQERARIKERLVGL